MKPVVLYIQNPHHWISVGQRAYITIVSGHPDDRLNDNDVSTSEVLSYDPVSGIFETMNSIYKPNILLG